MRALGLIAVMALAACDPQALADKAVRRTAESVVQPILAQEMTGAQASSATQCILDSADQGEIEEIARNVGQSAGSLTVATIRNIAQRPASANCFAANGVPALRR